MNGSIVFTSWRQCALLCGHIGASWRIRLSLCFLRPTQVHNPNGKSIGPAIFAQLMAECHWVHWRHLPNTIEAVHTGASWQMRLNLCFTRSTPSPQPKRQIDRFSRFCTAHGRTSLYCTMSTLFSQNCPQSWGDLDPHLIHDCLGESMPTIQTASRWVQPFSHT